MSAAHRTEAVHVFGIRHHGPGSARSLERAFAALRPDCVLVEGPPDAELALPFAGDAAMRPPVALLVHAAADPARAVFFPFAHFSPEWVALRWALAHAVPVRFIDLPIALQLGEEDDARTTRGDPLEGLAQAAGYPDADLFWERLVETANEADPFAIFAAVAQAMTALREGAETALRERRREAHMRLQIRRAQRALFQRIAIVVGAWHVPAMDLAGFTATGDRALLEGLDKTRTEVAWIPWTSARLGAASGYGAGVRAPGWYAHLFAEAAERRPQHHSVATAWAVRAARHLREASDRVSPAQAVEVVRLCEALAALRALAAPGLEELHDAMLAVYLGGDEAQLTALTALEVGDEVGAVPPDAPATPLRRDVAAALKHLRMQLVATAERHEWDLRKPLDRERVTFLHRLAALGIDFGQRLVRSGEAGAGTFKEVWQLRWDPAFEVELALAARWGSELSTASDAILRERAKAATLPELAADLELALDAHLPFALAAILRAMTDRAAATSDVMQLGQALPRLALVVRYSDVRETDPALVWPVLSGLFVRCVVGLPSAVANVDEATAWRFVALLDDITRALALVDRELPEGLPGAAMRAEWHALLRRLAHEEGLQGALRGRAVRLLVDAGELDEGAVATLAGLALGRATPAARAATWIEGLVGEAGAGALLEHHEGLWRALDGWLASLDEPDFVAVLPLLRRAFARFAPAERRRMAGKIARLGRDGGATPAALEALDPARVALLRPVLALILGGRDE